MYRIIEEEKELRSRKAESLLWSEATGDSKVKPKKHWSDKQRANHQKIATTNKIILQVSLANSRAVFGLRVKPSKSALGQSSFPWQVKITLIMMADDGMVILLMILIMMMMMVLVMVMKCFHIVLNGRNSAVGQCQIYLTIKLAAPSYSSPWDWLWAGDRDCKYYYYYHNDCHNHYYYYCYHNYYIIAMCCVSLD